MENHDIFKQYYEEKLFSGAGLIMAGENPIFSGAFGLAHKAWQIPNSLSTRFDTASITKLFTAVAVLQLIDAGKISFQDQVTAILGLIDTKISDQVNIYHLLTHTSGIGDDADEEAGESYEAIWQTKPNYSVRETADFLPQFIHKKPNFEPGKGCRYNNVAYVLLGLIIEKLTGMKYRDYVTENIFKKVGMSDTEFCSMDGIFANVAEGYVMNTDENNNFTRWRKNIYSFPPVGSPDGGAYATVSDLDKFIRCLKNGDLLSKSMVHELFSPKVTYRTYEDHVHRMGYGFEFITTLDGEVLYMKKDGTNPGVACFLSYYPQKDITLIILANQDCDVWSLGREIHSVVMKEVG